MPMPTATPCTPATTGCLGMDQPAQEAPHGRPQAFHVLSRVKEIVEVAAGGEHVLAARDHHAMNGLAVRRALERVGELVVHRRR